MNLPSDDFILLSVINTALRDEYCSLEELCAAEDFSCEEISSRLAAVGYAYDPESNSFK